MNEVDKEGNVVRIIRTYGGGEFTGSKWTKTCNDRYIVHEKSAPYQHYQQGMIERAHRVVIDAVRTMLVESGFTRHWWAEAANCFVYTRNRIPRLYPNHENIYISPLQLTKHLLSLP